MSEIKTIIPFKDDNEAPKLGILYLRCSRRNVFCTLIDPKEQLVKFSCSLGISEVSRQALDFKNTYLKSKLLSQYFIRKIQEFSIGRLRIVTCGLGAGRATLLNTIRNSSLQIISIEDNTLVPHNGCRGPKRRRKKLRTKLSFKIKRLVTPSS